MKIEGGPAPGVRPFHGAGGDGGFVVKVTTPVATNALLRAHRALLAIGVQVLHTRLRSTGGEAVQTLHLAELDDTGLDSHRIRQVLATLSAACQAPGLAAQSVAPSSVAPSLALAHEG